MAKQQCEGRSPYHDWLLASLLIVTTLVVYLPALHGGFVWDDDAHISANGTLRSLKGLGEIWFKPGATCQYYPLTFSVLWVGYHLWGLTPLGYHLLNVLLHSLGAVLLWRVLARLRVRGSLLAGAIFALHPVCVMSVAWMTELKNTLSGVLALGAGWAYLRFAGLGGDGVTEVTGRRLNEPGARTDWRYYVLSLALFQLAVLAKTAVSFLPVSLFLVMWWQRWRLRWRDVWPLIPMLGIALVMGGVTIYVECHSGGASGKTFTVGYLERILISGRSFWFYLGKLLFPYRLTFLYERWHVNPAEGWQYLYPLATVGVLWGVWRLRRRIGKWPFVALLHFYVSTSMLILLVVLFMTRYSFVSDHWQYFGCMSVIAMAAAGITTALDFVGQRTPFLKPTLGGGLLLVLGILTWRQSGMYTDIETLWRTTIAKNPNAFMAYSNFGYILRERGQVDEAVRCFKKALEIKPDFVEALNNFGNALKQTGQLDAAIAHFRKALEIDPSYADSHYNLGNALLQNGQIGEAIDQFKQALEIYPNFADAHNNLGSAYKQIGRSDEAIDRFKQALKINPYFAGACFNLGNALLQTGRLDDAIVYYRKAVENDPHYANAHNNLGLALLQKGLVDGAINSFQKALGIQPDFVEAHIGLGTALLQKRQADSAIAQFQKALEIQPRHIGAQNRLAWVLATCPKASLRNGARAVELAQQAERLSGGENPVILRTLAAAYAKAGRFAEAIASAERALELARVQGDPALADDLQMQLGYYRAGSPFFDTSQTNVPARPERP